MLPSPLRSLLFNVGFGFTAALILMLSVIGLGVTQMAHLNDELEHVVSVNNVKTRLASRMRDTLRDRALLMHNIVVSIDPWEKDTLFQRFMEYGERYAKDRQQLQSMLDSDQEKQLLAQLDAITFNNQPIMFSVVDAALDENNYGALTQLQEEAIPYQNLLVEALDNMTLLQREDNEKALTKTYTAYQATRNLMLLLSILASGLAAIVAILVSRRMLKQTRQIEIQKQKYHTLFETNSDAVVILDETGFTDCNSATLTLFGMDSIEDFLNSPISKLGTSIQTGGTTAMDHANRAISQARTEGHAIMDWQGKRQDGSVFMAEIAMHAMQLEGKPVIQAIMRDVSERRAAEAAKEAVREAALQMARAKSEFVANVSHEIRTPMHGILGMSGLLLKTPLDGQQREYISTLKISAESLLTIINDILDFSKIEAGKMAVEQVAFSPVRLAQGVVALFQARALEKNLQLNLILPVSPPNALLGDPTRIRQILLNLIDNAIKFTHQGEVALRVSFDEQAGELINCQFSVHDTGIGISRETQTRLFQAFSQADTSTTRRYGGTGLGLAVSHQLAELMGGSLKVESTAEQGSCFTLTLSLPATNLPLAELPHQAITQLQGRILVVEDHPVNQKVLAHQLREMGLQHGIATSGAQALNMLASDPYDLVLMDWQMPEMDGLEATRRIRQLPTDTRNIPIIALTANANSGFREACLEAGANDYLSKPYSESALAALLAQRLPSIHPVPAPLLNLSALHARYPGNPKLVDDLAAVFISTTGASLASLKHAITQRDQEKCVKESHALRGAAASVMATEVQNLAAQIESSVQTGRFEQAAIALEKLDHLFQAQSSLV